DGQEIGVQGEVLAALKKGVAIVDEQHRRRVGLRRLKGVVNSPIKLVGAGDKRTVDQEELSLQTVGQGPADRCLARAGRAQQQYAALWLQPEFGRQFVVFQRQDDVGFQTLNDLVHPLPVP